MSSSSETGHAKNVANFQTLISYCKGYGASYQPSKKLLSLEELERLQNNANAIMTTLNKAAATDAIATDRRQDAFNDFTIYATRIVNALESSEASKQTVKDARAINRKIQGQRAVPKPKKEPGAEGDDKTISVSQQSFDSRIDQLSKILELLKQEPGYTPNEADLKITGIEARFSLMQKTNSDAMKAYTALSNARIGRKTVLYNPLSGLVPMALEVKKYVKSVFKANSEEYRQVSGIEFRNIKN